MFVGQLRTLKQEGKDISQSHQCIGPGDVARMYDSGTLSMSNPVSLQRKVFLKFVCNLVGMGGRV